MTNAPQKFEMANADDMPGIIAAAQKSILNCLQEVIGHMRNETKAPGLTWEQLEYMIEHLKEKKATIITQEHEV